MKRFMKLILFLSGFFAASALFAGDSWMSGLLAISALITIIADTDGL